MESDRDEKHDISDKMVVLIMSLYKLRCPQVEDVIPFISMNIPCNGLSSVL